jgi:PTH1 family peptidyl-tRNA hydrolase
MHIVAGLGNPGAKYENNRHNVGFMAADAIARRHSFSPWTKKFQALVAEGRIGDERVLLVKPQTYMNESGRSVGEAMRFHKVEPSSLTVLYDELDLAPAKVRVKVGGGAGGHNGIRSIDTHCGKDYRRVRIGIGHPGVKEFVHRHVLGDFAKVDAEWLDPMLDAIADNFGLVLAGQDSSFMNKIALATGGKADPVERPAPKTKGQSHVRQARPKAPQVQIPESGPMAAMLKRLFGK